LRRFGGGGASHRRQICANEKYDGAAADVWALGGTMFMLRFGTPPFLAPKVMLLCYKIIHEGAGCQEQHRLVLFGTIWSFVLF
jgi:serine/threonine protein kinase